MKSLQLLLPLALLPLSASATSSGNAGCTYAAENLSRAIPGWSDKMWTEKGRVLVPKTDTVVASKTEGNRQQVVTKGGGLHFANDGKPGTKTEVNITYDESDRIQRLEISTNTFTRRWTETLDYGHDEKGCTLKRVVVTSPELKNTKGVSFDDRLCEKLQEKKLLDQKTAQACGDYNRQLGETIDEFSASLPKDEAFTLFTTAPNGAVKLKKFGSRDYPNAASAVANDCLYSWRSSAHPPAQNGGVERGRPTDGETTASPAR